MSLLAVILFLVVAGVGLWAINNFVPMDPRIKQLINALIIIAIVIVFVIFLLQILGISVHDPYLRAR